MKNLIIFILLLFLGCKENTQASNVQDNKISKKAILPEHLTNNDYSGKWIYTERDENSDVPSLQFTITILQSGENIRAQYCAIANNGGKIDCESEQEYNIIGKITDGKITGTFYSFFGSSKDKGKFEISLINDSTISWKVINATKEIFYAPDHCNLKKKTETPADKFSANIFPLESGKTDNLNWVQNHEFGNYNLFTILPKHEKIYIKLAKNDMGDDEFYTLFTLNDKNKTIDSLKISYVEDGYPENNKRQITKFIITKSYQIILKTFERKDYKDIDLRNEKYTISSEGKFVKVK